MNKKHINTYSKSAVIDYKIKCRLDIGVCEMAQKRYTFRTLHLPVSRPVVEIPSLRTGNYVALHMCICKDT